MNRHAIAGVIRFPVFLLLWTLGVVLLMGRFDTADAMLPAEPLCGVDHLEPALPAARLSNPVIEPVVEIRDLAPASEPLAEAPPREERVPPMPMIAITLPAPVIHDPAPAPVRRRAAPESSSPAQPTSRPEADSAPVLVKAVSVRAGAHDLHKRDARAAMAEGRFAEAYQQLRPGVADARDDVEYLALLALAALHIEAADEAAVLYLHLVELQPAEARWRAGLDLAMRWHGDPPGGMTG